MSPLLRRPLLLLLLVAGCASQLLVVPDSDWKTVPPVQRAALDRKHDAEVATARVELAAASAGLAELQHPRQARQAGQARPSAGPETAPASPEFATPDPDDAEWIAAVRRYEQASAAARARIETARAASQRADLTWRQLRLDAATARLDLLVCARELDRAKAIDHNLPGTDTYESAPLRGQFSRAQQRWYAISGRAQQARLAFERAMAAVTSAKEDYALLMRGGPMQAFAPAQPSQTAADEPPPPAPRYQLSGWRVTRSDIRRRRGLGRFLDEADSAPARLRAVAVRLSMYAISQPASAAASSPDASPPAATKPSAAPSSGKPAAARPVEAPTTALSAGKPGAAKPVQTPPASSDSKRAAKPVEPPAAAVSTSNRPLAQPRGGAAPPVTAPAAVESPPSATVSASNKPASAPRGNTPSPVTTTAKPVEPPAAAAAAAGKPASTRGSSPAPAPTKPVEDQQ